MPKPGPRPKPASEKTTRRVQVMFTEAEFRRIRKAAGREALSTWCRAVLIHALDSGAAEPGKVETVGEDLLGRFNQRLEEIEAAQAELEAIVARAHPDRKSKSTKPRTARPKKGGTR